MNVLKLAFRNAAPMVALGAVATIAIVSVITDGRSQHGGRDLAASNTRQFAFNDAPLSDPISLGDIAVGQSDAPSVESAHAGLAEVDAERFPKGLVSAHATLPLGSWARYTNLSTGRSVSARVTGRPEDDAHLVVLSGDVAAGLGLGGAEDVAVMVEPMDSAPRDSRLLAFSAAPYDPNAIATGAIDKTQSGGRNEMAEVAKADRFLRFGEAASLEEAEQILARVKESGLANGRFGRVKLEEAETSEGWRVSLGPVSGWTEAIEARRAAERAGFDGISVIRN